MSQSVHVRVCVTANVCINNEIAPFEDFHYLIMYTYLIYVRVLLIFLSCGTVFMCAGDVALCGASDCAV